MIFKKIIKINIINIIKNYKKGFSMQSPMSSHVKSQFNLCYRNCKYMYNIDFT